jgi:hypothetical protein
MSEMTAEYCSFSGALSGLFDKISVDFKIV